MKQEEFNEIGNRIQEMIQNAVESNNFADLNENIKDALNAAVDTGSEVLKQAVDSGSEAIKQAVNGYAKTKNYHQDARTVAREWKEKQNHGVERVHGTVEKKPETRITLYKKYPGERARGIRMIFGGGILGGSMGIGLLATLAFGTFLNPGIGLFALGTAVGAGLVYAGVQKTGTEGRFHQYVRALGDKTYVDFSALSRVTGKPLRLVKKDVRKMIDKGWFLQGHIDQAETCLITSDETYQQYQIAQENLEQRTREEAERRKADVGNAPDPKTREILEKGNAYLDQIHKWNEEIPGELISGKISRIELLVFRIFERVKEHPEVIPDLRKMMDYYLPMTVKLLGAYTEMDRQPVQGENIRTAKKEIEDSLDTLNIAFEKLLDSIFQDAAWDVSSDISVLQTILAQDGLTESDFGE